MHPKIIVCSQFYYQMRTVKSETLQRALSAEQVEKIMREFAYLPLSLKREMRKYLNAASIKKAQFRETILEENVENKCCRALLLVQGTVELTKRIGKSAEHSRGLIEFAEISAVQVLGLESLLYDNRVKYTVKVKSGTADYLSIKDQELLLAIFQHMEPILKEREARRDREIHQKLSMNLKKENETSQKKLVERLSLPNIKLFSSMLRKQKNENKGKSRVKQEQNEKQVLRQQNEGHRSEVKSNQFLKKFSEKKIASNNEQVFALEAPIRKSQRKKTESLNHERSEKLFKQHLKTIIKRKLIYERKQLGVLKAFRQNIEGDIVYHETRPGISHQGSEVDQYFHM